MSDTDRLLDCAEYVLGTLDASERAEFERALLGNPRLGEEVRRWEDWLSGLNDAIPEVTPSAETWTAIARRLRPETAPVVPAAGAIDLAAFRRSRSRWRAATVAFGSLAAALALFIASERLRPPPPAYLAVVDRGGDLPALIVHVDLASDTVSVRSLSAETPDNRVLQLWFIAGGQAPRSVGLLDRPETRAALPTVSRGADLTGATFAVSVEPPGGSTTGAPTGPVVYSGKLIRDQ
ncbi:MAG: anti-sigma factor [Pseudomonadota bacterium]|nr:anti-sigma factor [Pseudomonadota bacterium]